MTETIEDEAGRRVQEQVGKPGSHLPGSLYALALEQLITEHRATKAELEAFRREVSDAAERLLKIVALQRPWLESDADQFASFIIPQPDPLAEAWIEATGNTVGMEPLNAALAARGLKIVQSND